LLHKKKKIKTIVIGKVTQLLSVTGIKYLRKNYSISCHWAVYLLSIIMLIGSKILTIIFICCKNTRSIIIFYIKKCIFRRKLNYFIILSFKFICYSILYNQNNICRQKAPFSSHFLCFIGFFKRHTKLEIFYS
jgi:hypothetical protein